MQYLSLEYSLSYKILSGKDKISGTIYYSSSFTTFKDIGLSVTYVTETGTVIGSDNYVVYDYVYPECSLSFNIKTVSPDGTKKIGVEVKSAKGE